MREHPTQQDKIHNRKRRNKMQDVIIPTWAEVNSWVVLAIAAVAFYVYAWIKAKKEDRTVTWVRDWEE
jgi:hypothetical protein